MKKIFSMLLAVLILCAGSASVIVAEEVSPEQNVINLIGNIGYPSLKNEAAYTEAKSAYDALTDEQKAAVTNADKLTEAAAKIDELKATDWAVENVISRINGLEGLDYESEESLKGVVICFEELIDRYVGYSNFKSDAASKVVSAGKFSFEYDVRVHEIDAVNGYPLLSGYTDASCKVVEGYDFNAGGFFIGTLSKMSDGYVKEHKAFAEAEFTFGVWHHYKVSYDEMTISIEFDGKPVVSYTAAEGEFDYLYYIFYPQWIKADFANMIFTAADGSVTKNPIDENSFYKDIGGMSAKTIDPTTMGAENLDAIVQARAAYDALDEDQKALVTNYDKLVAAEENLVTVIPGDVNGDEKVNVTDAVLIVRYAAKWSITIDLEAADYNADGTVNVNDAVAILRTQVSG